MDQESEEWGLQMIEGGPSNSGANKSSSQGAMCEYNGLDTS